METEVKGYGFDRTYLVTPYRVKIKEIAKYYNDECIIGYAWAVDRGEITNLDYLHEAQKTALEAEEVHILTESMPNYKDADNFFSDMVVKTREYGDWLCFGRVFLNRLAVFNADIEKLIKTIYPQIMPKEARDIKLKFEVAKEAFIDITGSYCAYVNPEFVELAGD